MRNSLIQKELTVFLCIIFCALPLFYTNYYYNIQASKSWFFVGSVGVFFVLISLCGMIVSTEGINLKKWEVPELLPVISIFLFLICVFVSTFVSDDINASLKGSNGRSMGLLWVFACVICFFMCWGQQNRHHNIISIGYAVSFSLVILIGLAHALGWNIGDFLSHVPEKYTRMYLSTIGYVNFFSQFASFGAVVFTGLFCFKKEKWNLIVVFISYIGLLIGNSDAGIMGWAVTVMFVPILMVDKKKDLEDLLLCLVILGPTCILIRLLYPKFIGYPAQSTLCETLMRYPVALSLLVITLGLFILVKSIQIKEIIHFKKIYKYFVCGVMGVIIILVIISNTGVWNNGLLTITDNWGSNRGFIWRKVIEIFNQSPSNRKWWGYGPDGMLPVMNMYCHDESLQVTGQIFDSAHNDFLQYMITIGLPGAILYLSFWLTSIISGIHKKNKMNKVWLIAVICYIVQAFIVPSQPMTTPFAFAFAGLMMAEPKESEYSK